MRSLMILILAASLISCQTYKERFVSMHHNKENDHNCFWLQSIVKKEDIGHKSEKIHIHYCCPNKDVDDKKKIVVVVVDKL